MRDPAGAGGRSDRGQHPVRHAHRRARAVDRRGRSARILSAGPRPRRPETELSRLRAEYFARPRACLRASPLPKTFGWGLHYDADGWITLHAVDSPEYAQLSIEPSLTQLCAMRSSRAAG